MYHRTTMSNQPFGMLSNRMFHSDYSAYSSIVPSPLDTSDSSKITIIPANNLVPIQCVNQTVSIGQTISTTEPAPTSLLSDPSATTKLDAPDGSSSLFRKSYVVLDHGQIEMVDPLPDDAQARHQTMKQSAKKLQNQSNGKFVVLNFVDDWIEVMQMPQDANTTVDDDKILESFPTTQPILYTVRYDQIAMFKLSRKDKSFFYFCHRKPIRFPVESSASEAIELNNNNESNFDLNKTFDEEDCKKIDMESKLTVAKFQNFCHIYHATSSASAQRIYTTLKHSIEMALKTSQPPPLPPVTTSIFTDSHSKLNLFNRGIINSAKKRNSSLVKSEDQITKPEPALLKVDENVDLLSNIPVNNTTAVPQTLLPQTTQNVTNDMSFFDNLSPIGTAHNLSNSGSGSSLQSTQSSLNSGSSCSSVDLLASLIQPPPPPQLPLLQQQQQQVTNSFNHITVVPSVGVNNFHRQHHFYSNVMGQYLNVVATNENKQNNISSSLVPSLAEQSRLSSSNPFLNHQMAPLAAQTQLSSSLQTLPKSVGIATNPFFAPQSASNQQGLGQGSGGATIANNFNQTHHHRHSAMPDIVSTHSVPCDVVPSTAQISVPYPGPNYSHNNFVQQTEQPLFDSTFNDFLSQTVKNHFHKQPSQSSQIQHQQQQFLAQRHLSTTAYNNEQSDLLL